MTSWEKHRQRCRAWHKANPGANQHYLYGITFKQMREMYISQFGECGICGNKFKSKRDIHIDHDHKRDKVRQLLCHRCNLMIGWIEDRRILSKAIEYLNKWDGIGDEL